AEPEIAAVIAQVGERESLVLSLGCHTAMLRIRAAGRALWPSVGPVPGVAVGRAGEGWGRAGIFGAQGRERQRARPLAGTGT
ncbi:MAG TPA: hypothetical protein PLK46_11485, partial [Propioniciclava sp.]|uniref:hypothetical protein n=1 Tax=Propioniciclava sp. TaxID=2038686 RepID=UPI002CC06B1B